MKTTVIFFKNKLFTEIASNIVELSIKVYFEILSDYDRKYKNSKEAFNETYFIDNHYLYPYYRSLHKLVSSIPNDFYFDDIFTVNSEEEIELNSLQETINFFDYRHPIFLAEDVKVVEKKINDFWKENPKGCIWIC